MKLIITLAMLTAAFRLELFAGVQEPKPQPPPPKQEQRRMEIPADAVFYQDVTWSPDGKRLAYTMLKGEGGAHWNLYVMRADGTGPEQLTRQEGLDSFYTA